MLPLFAAGSVLGVLCAPDKGERTQRKVNRKARKLFYTVDDTIEHSKDTIEELMDNLKDKLEAVNAMVAHRQTCSRQEAGKDDLTIQQQSVDSSKK